MVTWWAGAGCGQATRRNGRARRLSAGRSSSSVTGVAAPVIGYRHGFNSSCHPTSSGTVSWSRPVRALVAWLSNPSSKGTDWRRGQSCARVVAPPLPYRMRLRTVRLGRCVADLHRRHGRRGPHQPGCAPIAPERGTWAEVSWNVEMRQPAMRLASRFGHPLLKWRYDRVVEHQIAGFRRRLKAADT